MRPDDPLEAGEHRRVLTGERDHDDRLRAPGQPIGRCAGRLLLGAERVVVVAVGRLQAREQRRDRRGIQPRIGAAVAVAPECQEGCRGEGIAPRGEGVNDPHARRGTRERLTCRILEFAEPGHPDQSVPHRPEGLDGRCRRAGTRADGERDLDVGRRRKQAGAAVAARPSIGVARRGAGEGHRGCDHHADVAHRDRRGPAAGEEPRRLGRVTDRRERDDGRRGRRCGDHGRGRCRGWRRQGTPPGRRRERCGAAGAGQDGDGEHGDATPVRRHPTIIPRGRVRR